MRTKAEWRLFSNSLELDKYTHFFLVGIGGTGMCPLAKMLHQSGYHVRGSNNEKNTNTTMLSNMGIDVTIGHHNTRLLNHEAVIITDAIELESNPEFQHCTNNGNRMFRRVQILNYLLKNKKIIAVTGTHGKTTTTSMLAYALTASGYHPSFNIGTYVPQLEGNAKIDRGEYAIVEACEAYDSMHDLDPHMVILTNLEPDHLDYHQSYEALQLSITNFINRIPANGCLIYCEDDPGSKKIGEKFKGNKIGYNSKTLMTIYPDIQKLTVPGKHNELNAGGVLTAIKHIGSAIQPAANALENYQGSRRRMEIHLDGEIIVMDDYAHHPTEIKATITALKDRYPTRRLVYVFQPQLYSRTREMKEEFGKELSAADVVIITDIYPSRENPTPGVGAVQILPYLDTPHFYIPSRHLLPRFLNSMAKPNDLIIGSGVGNIGEMGPILADEITRNRKTKVGVLYGGDSTEREISILSGIKVQEALIKKGYDAFLFDVTEAMLTTGDLSKLTGPNRPDLLFLALHGTHAEDGAIQGLCELLHIPYTHSGITASAITMNKHLTTNIAAANGILTPKHYFVSDVENINHNLNYPIMVKANSQGSTIGITKAENNHELEKGIKEALLHDTEILLEEFIEGIEISVPVLNGKAMPSIEIVPTSGAFDYNSKYTPGASEEISPARIPKHLQDKVENIAEKAHHLFNCQGLTRSDFILKGEDFYFLEINTIPGMTETSLTNKSAHAMGITYEDLCDMMAKDALLRFAEKEKSQINHVIN